MIVSLFFITNMISIKCLIILCIIVLLLITYWFFIILLNNFHIIIFFFKIMIHLWLLLKMRILNYWINLFDFRFCLFLNFDYFSIWFVAHRWNHLNYLKGVFINYFPYIDSWFGSSITFSVMLSILVDNFMLQFDKFCNGELGVHVKLILIF